MNSERRAEIIKIRNCVPFIEPDAGVDETQAAFDELLAALDAAERQAPAQLPEHLMQYIDAITPAGTVVRVFPTQPAQPDDRLARAVELLRELRDAERDWIEARSAPFTSSATDAERSREREAGTRFSVACEAADAFLASLPQPPAKGGEDER